MDLQLGLHLSLAFTLLLSCLEVILVQGQTSSCDINSTPHQRGICGERLARAHQNLCHILTELYPDYFNEGKRSMTSKPRKKSRQSASGHGYRHGSGSGSGHESGYRSGSRHGSGYGSRHGSGYGSESGSYSTKSPSAGYIKPVKHKRTKSKFNSISHPRYRHKRESQDNLIDKIYSIPLNVLADLDVTRMNISRQDWDLAHNWTSLIYNRLRPNLYDVITNTRDFRDLVQSGNPAQLDQSDGETARQHGESLYRKMMAALLDIRRTRMKRNEHLNLETEETEEREETPESSGSLETRQTTLPPASSNMVCDCCINVCSARHLASYC